MICERCNIKIAVSLKFMAPAAFKEPAGFGFFLSGARAAEFSPDTGASISVERASELQSSLNSRATLT